MFERRVSARMGGTVKMMFGRNTKRGQTEAVWTVKGAKCGTGRQEAQKTKEEVDGCKREEVVLMCCCGDP